MNTRDKTLATLTVAGVVGTVFLVVLLLHVMVLAWKGDWLVNLTQVPR